MVASTNDSPGVALIDLAAQRARLEPGLTAAMERVLAHGEFIMGPEVGELERRLEHFTNSGHCITCANGTDAISLVLMAEQIGPGDAVVVPSFTFVATAEAVAAIGATPVFADVDPLTFNIDPASAARAIDHARTLGLEPRMLIAVDLFGQPADYVALGQLATDAGMCLVADAAQSFGARLADRPVGTLAEYTTTSFFPSKPLGCYGDGGAVLVDDELRAATLGSLRVHGRGSDKYDNVRVGMNSRLDTLQAAVLLEKLRVFDHEIERRNEVASLYIALLDGIVTTPVVRPDMSSVWAQFTVQFESENLREHVRSVCASTKIATAVYYPRPIHLQPGYRDHPRDPHGLAHSEHLAATVLSLPMHPYLSNDQQQLVVSTIAEAVR